jgi:hypothetical protein
VKHLPSFRQSEESAADFFAAWEQPQLFAKELRAAFRSLPRRLGQNSRI